jgi:TetR/AcrR family fatty acid metabolism transcriptional regulator
MFGILRDGLQLRLLLQHLCWLFFPVEEKMRTKNKEKIKQLAEQRRNEILDAASQVFSKYGFAKTIIDQVASQANLGKGTVYQYFKSKNELFLSVGERGMDRLKDSVLMVIEEEKDPISRIEKAIRAYLSFFEQNSNMAAILMQEQSAFKKKVQKRYFEHYYGHINKTKEIFKTAISQGLIKDINVDNAISILMGMLSGLVYMWQGEGMKYSLKSRVDVVLEIFFTGVLRDEKRRQKYEKSK